ncbi:MAG TPA: hypothetical protein VFZ58_03430 [Candidatus Saccharimonadales bacterium]
MHLYFDDVGIIYANCPCTVEFEPERLPGSVELVVPPESPGRQWVIDHTGDTLLIVGQLTNSERSHYELSRRRDLNEAHNAAKIATSRSESTSLGSLRIFVAPGTEIEEL